MIINEHNYVDEAEKTVLRLSQKKIAEGSQFLWLQHQSSGIFLL